METRHAVPQRLDAVVHGVVGARVREEGEQRAQPPRERVVHTDGVALLSRRDGHPLRRRSLHEGFEHNGQHDVEDDPADPDPEDDEEGGDARRGGRLGPAEELAHHVGPPVARGDDEHRVQGRGEVGELLRRRVGPQRRGDERKRRQEDQEDDEGAHERRDRRHRRVDDEPQRRDALDHPHHAESAEYPERAQVDGGEERGDGHHDGGGVEQVPGVAEEGPTPVAVHVDGQLHGEERREDASRPVVHG
mmetsp:Transcript_1243/g.3295  ORF Transcript_1243/g.3295 Transcript_1243/m.3295 type:complete len:248 (-) Transcript_1243:1428-2171(-)